MTKVDTEALLETNGMAVAVQRPRKEPLTLVSDVSLSVARGQCHAIVGESGSGKSITAMAIAGLLPSTMHASGQVFFEDQDVLPIDASARRALGGAKIGYVFQDAMTALHPLISIREQMTRPIMQHKKCSKKQAHVIASELLVKVGIPPERNVLNSFVHQLSGGMRQRVMIAMALSCGPSLLIADEPTTALDAAVQGRIMDLLNSLRESENLGMILISHDISIVAQHSERLSVMYAGQVIETGATREVLESPQHPYSQALINASPERGEAVRRLPTIPGQVPALDDLPQGCRFAPRCGYRIAACDSPQPMVRLGPDRNARCCNTLGANNE